jgi:replicative superfamily II helicase
MRNFKKIIYSFSNLNFSELIKLIVKYIFSMDYLYILTANIDNVQKESYFRYKYVIKKMEEMDLYRIRDHISKLEGKDRKELLIRLIFYEDGFKNCYVVRNSLNKIIHLQWIISPNENSIITEKYPTHFRKLQKKQIMLENAFTFPKYRGIGLFPVISKDLLFMAKKEGYKYAIVYVKKDAIYAINENIKIGFRIRKIIKEYKIFGKTLRLF